MQAGKHRQSGRVAGWGRSAFTLVELLVVVAIVVVLMSLLIPGLARAKKRARLVACSANVRSIGLGLNLYAADENNCYYPIRGGNTDCSTFNVAAGTIAYHGPYGPGIDDGQALRPFFNAMLPTYYSSSKIFFCPTGVVENPSNVPNYETGAGAFSGYYMWLYYDNYTSPSRWRLKRNGDAPTAYLQVNGTTYSNRLIWDLSVDWTGLMGRTLDHPWQIEHISDTNGLRPAGQNCMYMDMHVEWLPFSTVEGDFGQDHTYGVPN